MSKPSIALATVFLCGVVGCSSSGVAESGSDGGESRQDLPSGPNGPDRDASSADAGSESGGCSSGTDAGRPAPFIHCCLNNVTYDCPTKAAANRCAGVGGGIPDPSVCTKVTADPKVWCSLPPVQQNGNCTAGEATCHQPEDCIDRSGFPLPGYWCNVTVGRCFDMGHSCIGTACSSDSDCSAGERCDTCAKKCVALK
jgi:hypothetical protein